MSWRVLQILLACIIDRLWSASFEPDYPQPAAFVVVRAKLSVPFHRDCPSRSICMFRSPTNNLGNNTMGYDYSSICTCVGFGDLCNEGREIFLERLSEEEFRSGVIYNPVGGN